MTTYNVSIFIFRRDLRIHDNIGLLAALNMSNKVIPCFIFTPEQLTNNKYKSDNAVQFMMESLDELDESLNKNNSRLFYFYGKPHEIIDKLITKTKCNAVFVNMDYTPYSVDRDKKIENVCKKHKIVFESREDVLLNPVATVLNGSNEVYTKFTPFFNKAKSITIDKPKKNNYKNYISKSYKIVGEYKGNKEEFYEYNENVDVDIIGGRQNALDILKNMKDFKKYNDERNTLILDTTKLSAHNRFGTVSIREVYWSFKEKLGTKNDLIKQLYWRDFYYNVAYKYPYIFEKYKNLKPQYDNIKWLNNKSWLKKWQDGMTGFPVVDAAMRELNITGFMHNRGRLIVSNFLIKVLMIDWKIGELYFSQKLVDHDVCVNNGNWAWSSGSGADSQPYFRVFNPWTQGKDHDPDCEYIKKWIPELKDVPNEDIHEWYEKYMDYNNIDYPKPIVDYVDNKKKALAMYKKGLY